MAVNVQGQRQRREQLLASCVPATWTGPRRKEERQGPHHSQGLAGRCEEFGLLPVGPRSLGRGFWFVVRRGNVTKFAFFFSNFIDF